MDTLLILLFERVSGSLQRLWARTVLEDMLFPLATLLGLSFGFIIPGNEILPENYRIFSSVMGWTYFFMWAISFWPQVVTNYKNQGTIGLKSDKLAYDLIGFECLVIYEGSMFFSSYTRALYVDAHDGNSPEVEINDVWFANHSLLLTFIVIGQMIYYDGWKQWPTKVAVTICSLLICIQLFGLGVLAVYGAEIKALSYLTWLYLLSAIKVLITFLKFLPQVLFNFERKSTQGWSMPGTIMDLMGSILSISQLLLDCYFLDDWKGVEGNFIKLGLGMISGTYDVIFIVQHYILYPGTGDEYKSVGSSADRESEVDMSSSESGQGLLMYRHVEGASESGDSGSDSGSEEEEEGGEDEEEVYFSPFPPKSISESISSSSSRNSNRGRDDNSESDRDRLLHSSSSSTPSALDMDVTWLVS